MANHKSAIKRCLQAEKRRICNRKIKKTVNTLVKKAIREVSEKKTDSGNNSVRLAVSFIAKASQKGAISEKSASRKISNLMKKSNCN